MKTDNLRTATLDQISDLPVYPVADLFPMLSEEAVTENKRPDGMTMRELAESIRDNGLQEPIVLYKVYDEEEGNYVTFLLDGRNRRQGCIRAAKMSGVAHDEFNIQVEDFIGSEEEADEFVLTLNIDRRNMTPGQRAFVAVEWWDLESKKAESRKGTRTDLGPNSAPGSEFGRTAEVLAARFRVGKTSIKEARDQKKKIQQIEAQIEMDRNEVERQKAVEVEAKKELEAARIAGDSSKVKDAAHRANNAASAVSDTQEKLVEKANLLGNKKAKIDKVKSGKESLNSLKTDSPGQSISPDDPLARFRSQLSNAVNKFQEAARELLDGERPEDWENVRLKEAEIHREFGNIDPVEGLADVEESRERFALREQIASDHGAKMADSPKITVLTTKPCGCDFSGMQDCSICRK